MDAPIFSIEGHGRPSLGIVRDKILLWFVLGPCPIILPFMGVYKGPSYTIVKITGAAVMVVIGLAATAWFANEVRTWMSKYTIKVWSDRIIHEEKAPWNSSRSEYPMSTIAACEPFAPLGEEPDFAGYVRLTIEEAEIRLNIGSYAAAEKASAAIAQAINQNR